MILSFFPRQMTLKSINEENNSQVNLEAQLLAVKAKLEHLYPASPVLSSLTGGTPLGAKPPASKIGEVVASVWPTVLYMLVAAAKTVITTDPYVAIHRTALFLLMFVVVHMLGNLNAFLGPSALNYYGTKLSSNPFLVVIESYLALVFLAHAVAAVILSARKWRTLLANPLRYGRLALTGSLIAAFVVVHTLDFRFAEKPAYVFSSGEEGVDFWEMSVDVFRSLPRVVFYVVSVLTLCWHLWIG